MKGKIQYQFSSKVWKHNSDGGWHFVSLPNDLSKEIRTHLKWQEEGWGRMKAHAQINTSKWDTAIWFDTKLNTYLLPVKATVRRKEKIALLQLVDVTLWI